MKLMSQRSLVNQVSPLVLPFSHGSRIKSGMTLEVLASVVLGLIVTLLPNLTQAQEVDHWETAVFDD